MLEDDDKREDLKDEVVEVEVTVDDKDSDTGSEVEVSSDKSSDDDELANYSESVKKRINKLTYKMREVERREMEALEYAKAVKAELDTIKRREQTINKSFETEAETRLLTQEQLYQNDLKAAVDRGDTDKQVEIQTKLVKLATEQERLRNYRVYRQQEEATPQPAPVRQPQQRVAPDRKAQEWAERNSWFGQDRIMTSAAYTIHDDLLSEGVNPSGDMYYKELDKRMREEFPQKFQPTKKSPTPTVASARPSQVKKSNGDIELSDTQKTIAKRLGISYDDYKRQLKLVQERA